MLLRLPRGYRAETETEVKRSRFITTLARVATEDAARALIAEVRRTYPDARHHCTAFVLDAPGAQPVERSSDDGEPAGTAGAPMLGALRAAGVGDVVAVVTRYFGGVLLGTGGLARAYGDAVSHALDAAGRVRLDVRDAYLVELDHADYGRVADALAASGFDVLDADFGERALLRVAVAADVDLAGRVARLTAGRGTVLPDGTSTVEAVTPG